MKRLFSRLGKKTEESHVPPPADSKSGGDSTTFLTGDDRIDARNLKLLLETMAELISDQDLGAVIRKIVDRAIKAVQAERGILFLSQQHDRLAVTVARDAAGNDLNEPRFSTTVVKQVHETGNPLSLKIGDSDQANDLSASVVDLKLRAVMCVRLRFQDKVLGVIYVDSRVTSREFSQKDLLFFDALAVALSISLENARLVTEALERQRLKQSLEIAAEILSNLLPADPKGMPGFDLAGRSTPAETAAGDYYDFIEGQNGVSVVVGDVTGHGVGPAMVMTGARAAVRTLFEEDLSEAEVLDRLNRRLADDLADDMFMSMLIATFESKTQLLRFANAGQSAPLLLRASGELEKLPATGLALGIEPEFKYENQDPIQLKAGDILAFFSDGFLEARNQVGEMFGEGRMAEVLRQNQQKPAQQILEQMYEQTQAFAGGIEIDDDLTLVIVKAL